MSPWQGAHQVMTLSGMGDAETPAGGSVCMRCTAVGQYRYRHHKAVGGTDFGANGRTLKSRMRRRRAEVDILSTEQRRAAGCKWGS